MRSARIDTLRGIAVFGILLVNVWSFVYGNATPRYGVFGPHSTVADQAVVFFVAAFAEQKFYPIFAFLFGAGFALQTGRYLVPGAARTAVENRYRRRIRWLLACGVLHGLLIWYGDILTTYAITAFWLAGKAGRRLRELADSLQGVLIVNILTLLIMAVLVLTVSMSDEHDIASMRASAQAAMEIYTQGNWSDIALLRWSDYGSNLLYGMLFFPRIALFFIAGVFAVRLGWLTRPQRHRPQWHAVLAVAIGVGLPLNVWWGYVALRESVDPFAPAPAAGLALFMIDLAGPCLAAGYIAVIMLVRTAAIDAAARVFAAVGRMALTNYLAQSLICMTLLQGFGLGLGVHLRHAGMLGLCVAIMLAQVLLSRRWLARHAMGPVEALWRRYTARGAA